LSWTIAKLALGALAVGFGIASGVAWYISGRHPVGKSGPFGYLSGNPEEQQRQLAELKSSGDKIDRGAAWNRRAGAFACVAAILTLGLFVLEQLAPH
jgi:hypothetical protein